MIMKLRCLIIDDEFLARKRLSKLLTSYEDTIAIVGECRNGTDALEKIALKEPDLIFLDIQMPDMDGFTVLSKLKQLPHVIFTTAYDQFALKAFEINAVDYLLKPFDEERLAIAIERITALHKQQKASVLEHQLKKLLHVYESPNTSFLNEITLVKNGRTVSIFTDDVICFKSDGNYVSIITEKNATLYRKTLSTLYNDLDKNQFLRIHRSIIINAVYIASSIYTGNNEYRFTMKNGATFTSSRSYKDAIAEFLSL